MKKILTLILVLLLALTFMVSCDKLAEIPGLGQIFGDEGNNGGENETPEVDADLQLAYDYVHQMTKTIAEVTGANYTVAGEVKIGDKSYTVKWEVSDSKVSLETSEDGLTVTVVVPSRTYEDIPYTLKFTVTNEKGETLSREYKHLVPEFKVSSFEEYMAAKEGDNLVVKGIVVAINSKAAGNTRNHLFLADEDVVGGYYSYQMEADPVADLGIEVGMTVLVTGPAAPYSGMMEIKGGVAEVVSTEKKTVDFVDVTADFAAGDNLGKYTALPVVIKGVTIGTQELGGTSEYLKFSLNGHTSYIRTYVTDFPTTLKSADKATIDAAHAAHFGWTADVYGIVVLYSGNPYLIPLSVDCFTNYVEVEMTDAEKIANSVENVVIIDAVKEDMVIELPIVGKYYDDVTITWTVDSTDYNIDENGKLTVKLGEAEVTLTLTATFKCGDATETKTYTVVVDAASDQEYITKPTADVAAGTAYKFGLVQGTLGKTLYLTGEVSGRYLVTTEYVKDAADVFVEAVDGGYKFYIVVDGANKYIEVYNNADSKLSVQFSDNASVFAYNATVNAWVTNMDGTDYYLGTYNNFNTVSASKLSYITAENTGVSQFPANCYTLATAELAAENTADVAADIAYKFGLVQGTLGKTLYLTGEVSGRYLVTTEYVKDAADVFVEAVDGGYKFYIVVDGANKYIEVYNNADSKLSVQFSDNASVFAYNSTVNAWVTNLDGTDYYLGTYNNFNTVSASKLSYITAENTGVSQFPGNFFELKLKETAVVNKSAVEAGEAYKFGLVQGTLGKTLYLTGEVSGRYLVTTEYYKDAVDVFVEAVDGGYKFYIVVDGANKYIEVYNNADSKLSVQFSDNASVFAYNATVNAWVTNMDGTDYYIGTYNNFNTVSASKLSYITAENTGVSQFPGNFFKYEFVSETPACQHANTETETVDPTCTKEGTTTVTCADCGKVVSTVKIASTGHSYADGVCSACGATQPAAGSVTVSKNISDLIVSEGWDNTTTKQEFALDSNVTVKVDGGSNSGKAYSDHIRVYATDTPAGSITISVCTGYELVSVKVTTVEGTYAFLTLGAGTDDISNQTVSVSGSSVVLNTIKNGSDGKQVRVLAIEVVYQAA